MLWREVKGHPHMITMEHGNAIAFALVCEVPSVKGWREVFRGGFFKGTSSDPFQIVADNGNANFKSFNDICFRIEKILGVRPHESEALLAKVQTEQDELLELIKAG